LPYQERQLVSYQCGSDWRKSTIHRRCKAFVARNITKDSINRSITTDSLYLCQSTLEMSIRSILSIDRLDATLLPDHRMAHRWSESHRVEEDVPTHHRDQFFVLVVDRTDQKYQWRVLGGFRFYIWVGAATKTMMTMIPIQCPIPSSLMMMVMMMM
jgi:hypothetical protein